MTGAVGPYRFLANSVLRFHGAVELSEVLYEAGFSTVEYRTLMLGAVAIHRAFKMGNAGGAGRTRPPGTTRGE